MLDLYFITSCVWSLIGAMLCIRSLLVWNHWCYASCAVSAGMEPLFLLYVWSPKVRSHCSMLCVWSPLVWSHWCNVICVISTGVEPLVRCCVWSPLVWNPCFCDVICCTCESCIFIVVWFLQVQNFAFDFGAVLGALVKYAPVSGVLLLCGFHVCGILL